MGMPFTQVPIYFSKIRSDAVYTLDLSLLKNTKLTEKLTVQFRAEAFNFFNQPAFGAPNTKPTSPAFGQVTTEINFTRQMQFGLKVLF
jgi:hypothetical protein